MSTTIRDMADSNLLLEEEEEEVEQHSWGHRPLEVIGGGDCSAGISSCQLLAQYITVYIVLYRER